MADMRWSKNRCSIEIIVWYKTVPHVGSLAMNSCSNKCNTEKYVGTQLLRLKRILKTLSVISTVVVLWYSDTKKWPLLGSGVSYGCGIQIVDIVSKNKLKPFKCTTFLQLTLSPPSRQCQSWRALPRWPPAQPLLYIEET